MGILDLPSVWIDSRFGATTVSYFRSNDCERNEMKRALGFLFHKAYSKLAGIVELYLI